MIHLNSRFFCFLLALSIPFTNATNIEHTITAASGQTKNIELHFKIEPNDFIYKEYIQLSIDHPNVSLSDWHSDCEPVAYYDPTFKDTKKIFNKDFTLKTQATYQSDEEPVEAHLRVNYYPHKKGSFCEALIPLAFNENSKETEINTTLPDKYDDTSIQSAATKSTETQPTVQKAKEVTWNKYITGLIKTTEQTSIRIILVFLLGLLLSLTPCIYPMIPITIGILQAQASKSLLRNFLVAILYTLGVSTTFAILGLLAAFAGQRIGSLMFNPWIILLMVALLTYVALSLFDLYDLYIPRFLQNKQQMYTGSLISAFLFGMISGTIASPCISPGLVFVITIVANLQDLFLGFILLLVFGFGLSLPLLIIGTFSGALSFFPKAGKWMVEIKHLLGFILFGMCFYFLNNILPWHILLWSISLFVFAAGIFYLFNAQKSSGIIRTIKTIVGVVLIASSVFLATKGLQVAFLKTDKQLKLNIVDRLK
ncbi:hypothetical protein E3J79_03450 [Candidatus Dependentiae bacterium]|nr:MAG: hypothetical protein E3J79_03450 [Candidatus Dependentiae bacterium]